MNKKLNLKFKCTIKRVGEDLSLLSLLVLIKYSDFKGHVALDQANWFYEKRLKLFVMKCIG